MTLENGTTLGPYKIVSKLGEGGMGEVYRAKDSRLGREVAVKVLSEHVSQDQKALARFHQENKAVAALSHPNIRSLYDIGTDKQRLYAVMELLEGESLAQRLDQKPMEWRDAVKAAKAIALGLAAAHEKGIVHRDIKPQNIFLTQTDTIKILDFGLARSLPKEPQKTDLNSTLTHDTLLDEFGGTIPYMSPEQVRSEPVDHRSDIFSLGCVIYEMLTSSRLFYRKTPAETLAAILHEKTPSLQEAGIIVPPKLQTLINLCLEKDPAHRLPTMTNVIDLLNDITAEKASQSPNIQDASVGVLLFSNLGGDQDDEYFSEGLTEELINSLVKIEHLQVASRTSSLLFKGKRQDVRSIGEQLNVRTIIEGSVRRSGGQLRITAQLINAADGFHLWSKSYNRKIGDVFKIQREIASQIAKALQVVLTDKDQRALDKAPTKNVEAYDHLLRGREFFYQFQRKGFERALKFFLHAVDLDPEFAGAYAWAAYCHTFIYSWFDATASNLNEAERTSRRAISLDPELAEAHVSRGMVFSLQNQPHQAEKELETALRLKPDLYEAHYFYSRLCFVQGKLDKAAELAEKASQQRPSDYNAPILLGMIQTDLGRVPDAKTAYRMCQRRVEKHLELFPEDTRALYIGASALIHTGQKQLALEWNDRALEAASEEPMTLYGVACNLALLGRVDKAISCLERAMVFGTLQLKWLENDPDLDVLRDRPRFQAFISRLKD